MNESEIGTGPESVPEDTGDSKPAEKPETLEQLEKALQECRQEMESRDDQILRLRAALDNERKLAAREQEKARKYAITPLLEALIPIKDSLEMGLENTSETADVQAVREGMKLTLDALEAALNRFGVFTLNPVGETFNPEHHEAISTVVHQELPNNAVALVHQHGYLLNDRLIRPARVTVVVNASDDHGSGGNDSSGNE